MGRIVVIAVAVVVFAYVASCWSISQPFAGARPVTLATRADAGACESTVRTLVERFPHRSSAHDAELADAGAFIETQVRDLGLEPQRQSYDGTRFNLLTRVGQGDQPVIVIGAHYDAHADTPGADDNASGVAVLLETLRLLRATPPSCRVEAAFWTLEEPPHFRTASMGSAHHVEQLQRDGANLRLAISLEMLGRFEGRQRYPPNFVYSPAYPSEGNFVLLLGESKRTSLTRALKSAFAGTSAVPIESINVSPTFPGADFSDHLNFWRAGYPAFMLTDTAFLRNERYHRATDTPATLDFVKMAAVADGVAAMVLDACQGP